MKAQLFRHIFSDNETLAQYEREGMDRIAPPDILRRLVSIERSHDYRKTDAYYDGMSDIEFKEYESFSDLMGILPYKLGEDFFIWNRGCLYVKEDKFEEWGNLTSHIPPSWIIAGYLSKDYSSEQYLSVKELEKFKRKYLQQFRHSAVLLPYIPDLEFYAEKVGGLNDLHIHLNGSTEIDVVWGYVLQHHYQTVAEYDHQYLRNVNIRKHAEQIAPNFTPRKLFERLSKAREIRNSLIEFLFEKFHFYTVFGYQIQDEILLYIMLMKYLRISHNQKIARMFHHYMLIKGLILRFVVMQQNQAGFSQFQLITANSFRNGIENYFIKRFEQLALNTGNRLVNTIEGRISPQSTSGENMRYVRKIVSGFEKAKKNNKSAMENTKLVLIAHFIKKPEIAKDNTHFIRHYFLRKEIKRKSIALINFKTQYPSLSKYIKGIDAASSEFDARPEIFAPTFRFLREHGIRHFTFHVGEDFCHLVSGYRAIFEAVEFLGLQSGDRLGHCTAIGLSPSLWLKYTDGIVYVSRGEWLDDLVFIWYLVKNGMLCLELSTILSIESEIAKLSQEIYHDIYLPHELAEAWMLRKFVPNEELNTYYQPFTYEFYIGNRDARYYMKDKDSRVGKIWKKYHEGIMKLSDDKRCDIRGCRQKYDEIIKINTSKLVLETDLYTIQKCLLEMLTNKNIVIEALPTSNMRISIYKSLREYHLKRWLNDEHQECLLPPVVLGSDDPGIFMTNIYNEYAMTYVHLKKNNFSPSKIMEKIKYIHEHSEIYNFSDGGQ